VELLAGVGDVEDEVGVPGVDAILNGGEVGGGIHEGAIAFCDEEGGILVAFVEDGDCALGIAGDVLALEVVDDFGEHGFVEGFAEGFVEGDAETGVGTVELGEGDTHDELQMRRFSGRR